MKKVLTNLLMMIAARLLMMVFGTFGIIYSTIKLVYQKYKRKEDWSRLARVYLDAAFGDDQKGNAIMREPFNDWFLKNKLGRYEYGNPDQTVSHVTGVNEAKGALTFWGRLLAGILNAIDEDHTKKAKDNPQYNA